MRSRGDNRRIKKVKRGKEETIGGTEETIGGLRR